MSTVLRAFLVCSLTLVLLGCSDLASGPAGPKQPAVPSVSDTHEEARKVLLDYANRYEKVYLHYEGQDRLKRLEEVTDEYHKRMSKLTEEGKWTPWRDLGKSLKLSFLIGEFHGALQSCKIERTQKDEKSKGCDEVKKLKDGMVEVCAE